MAPLSKLSHRFTDLELLQIEMDLLWADRDGPELVIACAREGTFIRINRSAPPPAIEDLRLRLLRDGNG